MAQMEHQRFVAERLETGWSCYAAGKEDLKRKTNPTLADWTPLPEEERPKHATPIEVLYATPDSRRTPV
jgi:hypothetical protein